MRPLNRGVKVVRLNPGRGTNNPRLSTAQDFRAPFPGARDSLVMPNNQPGRLTGYPAIEMLEGRGMVIPNDDFAEMNNIDRQYASPGGQALPIDFAFGQKAGAQIGFNRSGPTGPNRNPAKEYPTMYMLEPMRSAVTDEFGRTKMLSVPISTRDLMTGIDIDRSGANPQWTPDTLARAESLELQRQAADRKLTRPYTWVDSPNFGEDAAFAYRGDDRIDSATLYSPIDRYRDRALTAQAIPNRDVTDTLFQEPSIRYLNENEMLMPSRAVDGMLVRKASEIPSRPIAPIGGMNVSAVNPANVTKDVSPEIAEYTSFKNLASSGTPNVLLPSSDPSIQQYDSYPLIGRNPVDDYGLDAQNIDRAMLVRYQPIEGDGDEVRVRASNQYFDAQDQIDRLNRVARSTNAAYQSHAEGFATDRGYYPQDVQREVLISTMQPEAQTIVREVTEPGMPVSVSNSLIESYLRSAEMESRAGRAQNIVDQVAQQTMPLSDTEAYRVSWVKEMPDGFGPVKSATREMDFRDAMAKVRSGQQEGYGQLQQELPVAYDQKGERYSLMNVGEYNIPAYQRSEKGKADAAAGVALTMPNQFYAKTGPDLSDRAFFGQQSLPIAMGVNPSRLDEFTPEEAVRIQPVYQRTHDEMINTAGNRLRSEGYSPPALLSEQERIARLTGDGYSGGIDHIPERSMQSAGNYGMGQQGGAVTQGPASTISPRPEAVAAFRSTQQDLIETQRQAALRARAQALVQQKFGDKANQYLA